MVVPCLCLYAARSLLLSPGGKMAVKKKIKCMNLRKQTTMLSFKTSTRAAVIWWCLKVRFLIMVIDSWWDDIKRHQQKNSNEDKPENMEVVKPCLHKLNLVQFQETSLDASETTAEKSTSKHLDREHPYSPGHTEMADQISTRSSIPYFHHRGANTETNEKSWRNPINNIKFMGLSAFKNK